MLLPKIRFRFCRIAFGVTNSFDPMIPDGSDTSIGYAVSDDGEDWKKVGKVDSIDGTIVGAVKEQCIYRVWYTKPSSTNTYELCYATGETASKQEVWDFSGYKWWVNSTSDENKMKPGPNYWSNRTSDVCVDGEGLHLKIVNRAGKWYSTEVYTEKSFGYGTYVFYLATELEDRFEDADHPLDKNVVLGLFTYELNTCQDNANAEIDIELARWPSTERSEGDDKILNYSVQPTGGTGRDVDCTERNNLTADPASIFPMELNGSYTTHIFRWAPTFVKFESYHGHGNPRTEYPIGEWKYDNQEKNCSLKEEDEEGNEICPGSKMVGIPTLKI